MDETDANSNQSDEQTSLALSGRLGLAMAAHDSRTPPPVCVSCKLLYPISKRLDRKGVFFPCAKHFICWCCAEYMVSEQEEQGFPLKDFRCPGSRSCPERMSIAEAVERVRGKSCQDCSASCYPNGNEPPFNALGCPNCFRCVHCSARFARKATPASGPIICPSPDCGTLLDTVMVEILAQKRCAVCRTLRKPDDPVIVSACGSAETSHFVCEQCVDHHLEEESKRPFEEMKDVVECPSKAFGCVLSRNLVHSRIGSRCRQCKSRAKDFDMSECRTVCDACIRQWILTFTSDNHNVIRALPCPNHPKREECRINQLCIENVAGKVCTICFERKEPSSAPGESNCTAISLPTSPRTTSQHVQTCGEHFACHECLKAYCRQQMRDRVNAFSFPCPSSTSCPNRIYYSHIRSIVGKAAFEHWQRAKMDRGLDIACRSKRCQSRQRRKAIASAERGRASAMSEIVPYRSNHRLTVISSVEIQCDQCNTVMCIVCKEVLPSSRRSKKAKDIASGSAARAGHLISTHRCKDPDAFALLEHVRDPLNEIRPCIQCFRFIHREEGCNHMTCSGPLGCGAEFCWVCLKPMNTVHFRCPLLSFGNPSSSTTAASGSRERSGSFLMRSRLPSFTLLAAKWPNKLSFRGGKRTVIETAPEMTTVTTTLLSS